MRDFIKFIMFIVGTTTVFFLPNTIIVPIIIIFVNLVAILILKISVKKLFLGVFKIMPFVIFTFIVNIILDSFYNAIWIGIKLILVCDITYIYSSVSTVTGIANTIKTICMPLTLFKVNIEEIEVMVVISLSIIRILKKDLLDIMDVCKSKNIKLNIMNIKYIMSIYLIGIIKRTNQIDEALIAKGRRY